MTEVHVVSKTDCCKPDLMVLHVDRAVTRLQLVYVTYPSGTPYVYKFQSFQEKYIK